MVTLGEVIVHAHKNILGISSPVFEAMFTSDLQEKSKNQVKIIDMDSKAAFEFFKFIYTGETDKINEFALDLLNAAEK